MVAHSPPAWRVILRGLLYALAGGLCAAFLGVVSVLGGIALGVRFEESLGATLTPLHARISQLGWGPSGWVAGTLVGLLVGLVVRRPLRLGVLGGVLGAAWFIADAPPTINERPEVALLRALVLAAGTGAVVWGGVGIRRALTKRSEPSEPSPTKAVAVTLTFLLTGPAFAGPPDDTQTERLIRQLGSSKFAEREAAAKELERLGESALEALRKAALTERDAEIRRRAGTLVEKMEGASGLNPQEVAEGWIMLFDRKTGFGWEPTADATARDGLLSLGDRRPAFIRTATAFGDFDLRFLYRMEGEGATAGGLACRESSGKYRLDSEPEELLGDNSPGWNEATFQVRGGRYQARIQAANGDKGRVQGFGSDPRKYEYYVAFGAPAGSKLRVGDVRLRPVGLEPTFNAKGELSLREASGGIQTEKQWRDFILQMDCRTSGKDAAGGVFLRGVPGQPRSGYQVRVSNRWQGGDRTKPVDYGTGGLYGLQPARKVVSSDNRWFTMTVVAHDNHVAVWVNGYQTADYTDKRAAAKNSPKAPIRLVGDGLSFRNVRVAELPRRE